LRSSADWTEWWQDDLPCQFTPLDARENAAYLRALLGDRFLQGARHPISELKHPILQRWRTRGAGAFLELNALAADLRVVERADGITSVLHDLRNADRCLSSWHCIHAAALLSRPGSASPDRFFPQTDESLPDFLVSTGGTTIAGEAKLLAKSESEDLFAHYASDLAKRVLAEVVGSDESHPILVVVIKSADALPRPDTVVAALKGGRQSFKGGALEHRGVDFNLFVEDSADLAIGASAHRSCYILCPRSENEDLRVEVPGKKASKQLAALASSDYPGVLLLGLSRFQDPRHVIEIFGRRFDSGQYSGIGGVMLIRSGAQTGPPVRAPVDLVSVLRNERAPHPVPNFGFKTVGLLDHLVSNVTVDSIPAYRFQVHEVRAGSGGFGLRVPDLQQLRPAMLL
jgi:hypothetical protein